MENQIRVIHQKQPSISNIRPKTFPKVDPIKLEPYTDFEEDVARAEQCFKDCKNFQHWEEINRELEEIIGARLTPDEKRTIVARSERLSAGIEEKETPLNDTFNVQDSEENEEQTMNAFNEGLNFSRDVSDMLESSSPKKNIGGKELPITKSLCGLFTFQRKSKAEYVLRVLIET